MFEPNREFPVGESLEWLLGRFQSDGTAADDGGTEAPQAGDPVRAGVHDLAPVLARVRSVRMPLASETLQVRLRSDVRRRAELRVAVDAERARAQGRWRVAWRAACAAALVIASARVGHGLWSRAAPDALRLDKGALPAAILAQSGPAPAAVDATTYVDPVPPPEPVSGDGAFFAHVDAKASDTGADSVLAWLGARNALDVLRGEFRQRFSREERRSVLAATGATPAREDRIQLLADDIARKVEAELAHPRDPIALALGLRALLASGSSRNVGEHRLLVRRSSEALLAGLRDDADEDFTVGVLAAITDVAVVSGGREGETVRRHAERVARATNDLTGGRRPTLLHRQTRVASLADAGYVLRLAPAFGASAAVCARARRLVLAHLRERLDVRAERPDLIAAMLYGFSDLVDLAALDARLLLWDARQLRHDYLALLHYAWGQYPLRTGWASFQDDLRYLSTLPTPPDLADAAALLMTLATNFAAPGAVDLIARR